jgi:hypothetical protein
MINTIATSPQNTAQGTSTHSKQQDSKQMHPWVKVMGIILWKEAYCSYQNTGGAIKEGQGTSSIKAYMIINQP